MLSLKNVAIASLPVILHVQGVLTTEQMDTLNYLMQEKRFQDADSLIKKLSGARMNYRANYWPDVTTRTEVAIEIDGIADLIEGASTCKSIW